jgi:chemotaxis methyl-accepting protein methylase
MCKTGCAVGEEPFAVATTIHLAFDASPATASSVAVSGLSADGRKSAKER